MKILITGGMGFIGSNTVLYFAQNSNNEIVIIDNLSRHKHNIFLFDNMKNVEFWEADLRDFNTLDMIIESVQPEAVIHLAGQTAVTTSMIEPYDDFTTNVIGTVNLLECLRKYELKPKFLFTSTNKVYGNLPTDLATSEKLRIDIAPHTPYGCSKLCADMYVQEYGKTYGFQIGVFRMSCIYGVRQYGVEDQGWIAHFVQSALNDKKIKIFGDGHQMRDILYISDLIKAMELFIQSSRSGVWNVGGGTENIISLLELIDLLEKELGKKIKYDFYEWRPNDQKIYVSNIYKISKELDWFPKIGRKEGIKKLIEWMKHEV